MKVQFRRINFRSDTLTRFRSFSRAHGETHNDVQEGMLDFFTKYQLSLFQDFGPNIRSMEANIKKHINSLVALIKDINKHQTKPTTSMMQLLFEGEMGNAQRLVKIVSPFLSPFFGAKTYRTSLFRGRRAIDYHRHH